MKGVEGVDGGCSKWVNPTLTVKNWKGGENMKARLLEPGTKGMKVEPLAHCENPGEKPHCDIYG